MATRSSKHQAREDSFRDLKRDFDRRIRDLQAEVIEDGGGRVQESIDVLRTELEQRLTELGKQIDESVEPGREAIREAPYASMGVAVGAGVVAGLLLGIFLSRKSTD